MKRLTLFLFFVLLSSQCKLFKKSAMDNSHVLFDWQGHRGARGLLPENAINGMKLALDIPQIVTLEMDLAVTKDKIVILSHEPWMSHEICTKGGAAILEKNEPLHAIWQMTYDQVLDYDCGKIGHPRFPEQKAQNTQKPSLLEILTLSDEYALSENRRLPYYNIEIKSKPEWDGIFTPQVDEFVALVRQIVEKPAYKNRICIQSFDKRALNEYHKQSLNSPYRPVFAYLIEDAADLDQCWANLDFKPEIISPFYELLSPATLEPIVANGCRVIPWTVNDPLTMVKLINWGVDGIITDYPNRIELAIKEIKKQRK
jgi:glycerophosphoryl diester phosphodiesterase